MKVLIENNSSIVEENFISTMADSLADLELKTPVTAVVDDHWRDLDNPENKASAWWDGTAYDELAGYKGRVVHLVLSPECLFPQLWAPNRQLEGAYLRTTYLENASQLLVYLAAHEFRHCWQWDYPRRRRLGLEQTLSSEQDCDLYAIIKLNQWIDKNWRAQ